MATGIPKRLTVGDIQIYFDGDTARYKCARPLELPAVEKVLEVWQEFVERWLELAEAPRPVTRLPEEVELRAALVKVGAHMKRLNVDKELLKQFLRSAAEGACRTRWPRLTEEQREVVLMEAVAAL